MSRYTSYFGFREEPFSLTPTSRLFYSTPVYEKAYTRLLASVHQRVGLMLLTGEVGTGKTTLLRRLMSRLQEDPTLRVFSSHYYTLTFDELLSSICSEFGLETHPGRPLRERAALIDFLSARSHAGGTTVLLLDEAQECDDEVLEELYTLWQFLPSSAQMLQVVLVGQQPELEDKLRQPRLRPLDQRLTVRCRLAHLQPQEVSAFIHHRLGLVGCERPELFTRDALELIARYSQGIPRLINLLCDNALGRAYEHGQDQVSAELIQTVAQHFRLEGSEAPRPGREHGNGAANGAGLNNPLTSRDQRAAETSRLLLPDAPDHRAGPRRPGRTRQPQRGSHALAMSGIVGGVLVLVGFVLWLTGGHWRLRQTPAPTVLAPVTARPTWQRRAATLG
jgi:type II secretory pathway predicted ATPase ExeA